MDIEEKQNESRQNEKKIAIVVSAVAVVMALGLSVDNQLQQILAREPIKEIKIADIKTVGAFYFHICGDEVDPAKIPGTPENPLVLKKGQGQKTISFCVRSTETESKYWEIRATDIDSLSDPPKYGIKTDVEKKFLNMPAYQGNKDDFASGKGNVDHFNVFVSADKDAELGQHSFLIQAEYSSDLGGDIIGQVVSVDIQD